MSVGYMQSFSNFIFTEGDVTQSFLFSRRGGLIGFAVFSSSAIIWNTLFELDEYKSKKGNEPKDALLNTVKCATLSGIVGIYVGTCWKVSLPLVGCVFGIWIWLST